MLDPLQFYCRVLCNGMKTRFRMVMIAHPGPGIGFHKRFMWRIIIPPTACTKAQCHKPYGLLKQLPILICPWESVSMDFIEQLPASDRFMVILVVVDRLTKQSFDTIDTPQVA